jgi:ribonuclease BN (tRNA processing enzyme)
MMVKVVGGHGGVAPGFKATSYLIDGKICIDAGSCATGLLVDEQVLIDYILISHPHLDHIKDLAFIADNCFGMKGKPFEIYTNKDIVKAIKTHLLNDFIWPDFSKLPNKKNPTLRFNEMTFEQATMLGDYKVLPIPVNHPCSAMGFIVTKDGSSILFTQDTGPTEMIWEYAKKIENLKAIFTEASFPNSMQKVADDSQHHTPNTLKTEIAKMPDNIPIFIGHLKPNFQTKLFQEIDDIGCSRITILGNDDTNYVF